jgi:hypothetical protein
MAMASPILRGWPSAPVAHAGTPLNSGVDRVILLVAAFLRAAPTPIGENMNQPAPALPTSRRDTRGQACVKSLTGIKRRTGVSMPKHLLLKMAFDSGYEAGAEDAGSGELLVETLDLRNALYGLDGKTNRAIALDELLMAVSVETLEHEEDCRCGLCRALRAVGW